MSAEPVARLTHLPARISRPRARPAPSAQELSQIAATTKKLTAMIASWVVASREGSMNCGKKAPKKSSVLGLVSATRTARDAMARATWIGAQCRGRVRARETPRTQVDEIGDADPAQPLEPMRDEAQHRRHAGDREDEQRDDRGADAEHGEETVARAVGDRIRHDERDVGSAGSRHDKPWRRRRRGRVRGTWRR